MYVIYFVFALSTILCIRTYIIKFTYLFMYKYMHTYAYIYNMIIHVRFLNLLDVDGSCDVLLLCVLRG